MTRKYTFFFFIVFSILFVSCGQKSAENQEVLAKINDFELRLNEFDVELVGNLELDEDYKVTREAKQEVLERIIREQLLIQEAMKLKLERKEKFIRTIERYWKSTLIRDLMELKGETFIKKTYVTQEEVEARYAAMKKSEFDLPPFEEMQESIFQSIQSEKRREKLMDWIEELRQNAQVEIDEELLERN
ncbi:hypothetical protein ACFL9U_03270 [Thermodesulfobacteriota bacterium]